MPEPVDARTWRASLPDHPDQHRTGAVWLEHDPRDWPMSYEPGIAAVQGVGAPAAASNQGAVKGIYDQGAEGSCVGWSDCSAVSTEGVIGGGLWITLDGETFYHENGGTGQNGIDTRASLQRAVDLGIPAANSATRVRIGSYFFARRDPAGFIEDCEAAVAAGKCVVVAMLLPNPFGWESGDNPTQGYHQMNLVAYDPIWWVFANSWGAGFGQGGFVRVKKAYIVASNLQNGYAYAATVSSLSMPAPTPIPAPAPTPTPSPSQITLTGVMTGTGLSALAVGQELNVTSDLAAGKLKIVTLSGGPTPAPTPTPSPTPTPLPTPTPTPTPLPTPTPSPGGVVVNVTREGALLHAQALEGGVSVSAFYDAVVGGIAKGKQQAQAGKKAAWVVLNVPPGTTATVIATAAIDGRSGTGSLTL